MRDLLGLPSLPGFLALALALGTALLTLALFALPLGLPLAAGVLLTPCLPVGLLAALPPALRSGALAAFALGLELGLAPAAETRFGPSLALTLPLGLLAYVLACFSASLVPALDAGLLLVALLGRFAAGLAVGFAGRVAAALLGRFFVVAGTPDEPFVGADLRTESDLDAAPDLPARFGWPAGLPNFLTDFVEREALRVAEFREDATGESLELPRLRGCVACGVRPTARSTPSKYALGSSLRLSTLDSSRSASSSSVSASSESRVSPSGLVAEATSLTLRGVSLA